MTGGRAPGISSQCGHSPSLIPADYSPIIINFGAVGREAVNERIGGLHVTQIIGCATAQVNERGYGVFLSAGRDLRVSSSAWMRELFVLPKVQTISASALASATQARSSAPTFLSTPAPPHPPAARYRARPPARASPAQAFPAAPRSGNFPPARPACPVA